MSWLTIVFWLLTHLKDILSLVDQFLILIRAMPKAQADSLKTQMADAVSGNDVSRAREIITQTCSGVGCPSGLVG